MSVSLGANGGTYQYPQENDPAGWGDDATDWASAVSAALSNIGLGASVSADAVVNIISTSKGILVPRMTTTQRNAIGSPSTSLLIYNTTTTQYELYTGSTWQSLASYINGTLTVTGAASLESTLNVTGSSTFSNVTISSDLTVDTNTLKVDSTNNRVGIVTTSPTEALDVTGNIKASGSATITGDLTVDTNTLKVDSANNRVGIVTTSPTEALDVTGKIKASDQILTANGSVTAPFIAPSGDPNTGLYVISADKIGIAANGARVGEWGAGYGGFTGNVIQVVSATTTNSTSNTTNTYADISGLTASITPNYNTSKILVLVTTLIGLDSTNSSSGRQYSINLLRDVTQIAIYNNQSIDVNASGTEGYTFVCTFSYLDSPATTSSVTYKSQIKNNNTQRVTAGLDSSTSSIILLEVQQ
jgi:hypothetical protein